MSSLPVCMSVHHSHAWCPKRPEEVVGSAGTVGKDCCELTYWCWESNLSPLEDQPMFLTAQQTLQPHWDISTGKMNGTILSLLMEMKLIAERMTSIAFCNKWMDYSSIKRKESLKESQIVTSLKWWLGE